MASDALISVQGQIMGSCKEGDEHSGSINCGDGGFLN